MSDQNALQAERDANHAVWRSMPGSELLLARYGYYPSLHDAHVLEMAFDMAAHSLTMSLYVYDLSDVQSANFPPDRDVHCLIRLRWNGVTSMNFSMGDNWLSSLRFQREGESIFTYFSDQHAFIPSEIQAVSVEVLDVQDPPEIWKTPAGEKIDFVRVRCE